MASLTGTKIKDTYDGLLKTSDNGALGASAKLITDGLGNSSGVYLGTSGNVGINVTPVAKLSVYNTTAGLNVFRAEGVAGNLYIDHAGAGNNLYDAANHIFRNYAGTERMRIDSSGNALLNNTTSLLGVNSSAAADNKRIFLSGSGAIDHTRGSYIGLYGNQYPSGSAGNIGLVASSTGVITFHSGASATERMRITSGGYLKASNTGTYNAVNSSYHELYSTTTNEWAFTLTNAAASPYGQVIRFTGVDPNNVTNQFLVCNGNGTNRLIIYSNGNVVNSNNSYGAISDAKLKENVVDATPKLSDLMQVQIRNFNYIGSDEKQLGVVAQELEEVFPAMVSESPDTEEREVEQKDENGNIVYETEQVLVSEAVAEYTETIEHAEELDEEGNVITEAWTEEIVHPAKEAVYETVTTDRPVMTTERVDLGTTTKSVKYSVFVPILVKAMQEQQDIINKLEARIAALEAR